MDSQDKINLLFLLLICISGYTIIIITEIDCYSNSCRKLFSGCGYVVGECMNKNITISNSYEVFCVCENICTGLYGEYNNMIDAEIASLTLSKIINVSYEYNYIGIPICIFNARELEQNNALSGILIIFSILFSIIFIGIPLLYIRKIISKGDKQVLIQ